MCTGRSAWASSDSGSGDEGNESDDDPEEAKDGGGLSILALICEVCAGSSEVTIAACS